MMLMNVTEMRKGLIATLLLFLFVILGAMAEAQQDGSGDSAIVPVATPSLKLQADYTADVEDLPADMQTLEDYSKPLDLGNNESLYEFSIWRMLGSMTIVVLLIIALVYVLKLFWARGLRMELKGHHIKVIDTVQVGTGRQLYLVSVGNKVVLLGSNDKGLTTLMIMDEADELKQEPGNILTGGGVEFSNELMNSTGKKDIDIADSTKSSFSDKLKDRLKKLDE